MNNSNSPRVLADCKHMTDAVMVDGHWRTPNLCDDCILENAGRPLTTEQIKDFAEATRKILRMTRRESSGPNEN